jgi:hypothetical protein
MRRDAMEDQVGLCQADRIDRDFNRDDSEEELPSDSKEITYLCSPTLHSLPVPGSESLPAGGISNSVEDFFEYMSSPSSDCEDGSCQNQKDHHSTGLHQMVFARR